MAFLPTPVPMPVQPAVTPLDGAVAAPAPVPGGMPGEEATDASGPGFAALLAAISPGTEPDMRPLQPDVAGSDTNPGLAVAPPLLMAMAAPAISPPDAAPPSPTPDSTAPMAADGAATPAVATQMERPALAATVAPSPLAVNDPGALAAPPTPVPATAAAGLKDSDVTPIPPSGAPAGDPAFKAGVRSLRGAIIEIPAGLGLPDTGSAGIGVPASRPTPTPGVLDRASSSPSPGPLVAKPATDPTGTGQAAAAAIEANANTNANRSDPTDLEQPAADTTPQATSAVASAARVQATVPPATPVAPAALSGPAAIRTQANDASTGTAPPPSLRPEQPAGTIETATARPGAHETAATPAARSDNGFRQAGNGPTAAVHTPTGGAPAQGAAPSFAEQLAAMRSETGLPPQSAPGSEAKTAPGSEAKTAAPASDVSLGGSDPLAGMKSLLVPNAPPGGSTHGAGTTPQPAMPHTPPTPPAVPVSLGIARALADGKSRITVRLDPPELGRVEVRLDFAGDGTVRAMIRADSHHALELLQRDARHLERALTDSGLRADSGSLSFSLNQNGQQGAGLAGSPFGGRHGHGQSNGDASPEPGAPVPDPVVEPEPQLNYHGTVSTGVNLVI